MSLDLKEGARLFCFVLIASSFWRLELPGSVHVGEFR